MLVPQEAPNAFATGRNPEHGVVAVTEGLLRLLSPEELRGVIAHELGHIANRDILVQSIAAVLGGVVMMLANMAQWAAIFGGGSRDEDNGGPGLLGGLLVAILAPIAASLIQMAISRSREYLADATGATLSRSPLALAGALGKLDAYARQISHAGQPGHGKHVHRQSVRRDVHGLAVFHPPRRPRNASVGCAAWPEPRT